MKSQLLIITLCLGMLLSCNHNSRINDLETKLASSATSYSMNNETPANSILQTPIKSKRNFYLVEYGNFNEYFEKLESNIKMIRETRTSYRRDGTPKVSDEHNYFYNKNGVLNLYTFKTPDHFSREGRKIFQYDKKGNLSKIISSDYVKYGKINDIPIDKLGNLRFDTSEFPIYLEVYFSYDEQDRLIQEFWNDDGDKELLKCQYFENEPYVIRTSYINSTPDSIGDIGSIDSLFFDAKLNCIQHIHNYYAGETLQEKRKWWYENGLIKTYTELGEYEYSNPDSTIYQYNKLGNWIEKLIFRKNRDIQHTWKAEYKVDSKGNYTDANFKYLDKIRETVKREIEYWE
ncbi:hypothetical protein [Reichenbachiella sp.]|uniref:hypothetical protein n=2 Tax=Reichenbachiella sp. TaxID=2184521 RepID=UPI00329A03EC